MVFGILNMAANSSSQEGFLPVFVESKTVQLALPIDFGVQVRFDILNVILKIFSCLHFKVPKGVNTRTSHKLLGLPN